MKPLEDFRGRAFHRFVPPPDAERNEFAAENTFAATESGPARFSS